jgi:hypothetical protein
MKTMKGLKVVAFAALCAMAASSVQAKPLENGIGWNGIGWNGIGWNGIGWNGIGWNGAPMDASATDLSQGLAALADQSLQ